MMAPSSNPRGDVEMGVSYLFFALATFALSMRLISRLVILKNGGLDEVAIVVSYVSPYTLPECLIAPLQPVRAQD